MENDELSKAADKDFENIFEYGLDTFGLDQALAYQSGMKQRFVELAKQPKLYQAVKGYPRRVPPQRVRQAFNLLPD